MGLDAQAEASLSREFDMVMVQRKLKDAGRFVFIDRKNGNPSFLKFVEPTIEKARASLAHLSDEPRLKKLAALLDEVCSR
jgi:aminoglycoside/choline kinase family phosphotransferase